MKRRVSLRFFWVAVSILSIFTVTAGAAERPFRSNWSWPTYIDPAVGSDNSSTNALGNLYDTLVFPDRKGEPQPHVAQSWTVSDDGLIWTFKLRSDVKFHDGSILTSADVKFSIERLLAIGEGYAHLFTGKIAQVRTPNDQTVVFEMNKPFGPFLVTLYRLYILDRDQVMANVKKPGPYKEMGDYGKKYLLSHDAGSGPYKVKEFKVEERLVMELFTDYWQPLDPNVPDEYIMIGTTEAVTVRTLMSRRDLEVSDRWQAAETLSALKKIDGIELANVNTGGEFYFMIHTKKPPTDDIHFRKAMAWAMDYQTVVDHLFPGTRQSRGPIPQSVPGADPTVHQYSRDLERAKAELKKSKYHDKLDEYPVTIHWVAEVPDEEKVALLFMSNMADVGINVDVVKVPWMSVVEETAAMDTSPHVVTIFDNAMYPEAGSLLTARYASSSVATWEQNEWLQDAEYDAMLEDALETVDTGERFEKYARLQHYITDLCPTLFMFDEIGKHVYQSTYIDWPAARGENIPVAGFELLGREIRIYPEKRATLLK